MQRYCPGTVLHLICHDCEQASPIMCRSNLSNSTLVLPRHTNFSPGSTLCNFGPSQGPEFWKSQAGRSLDKGVLLKQECRVWRHNVKITLGSFCNENITDENHSSYLYRSWIPLFQNKCQPKWTSHKSQLFSSLICFHFVCEISLKQEKKNTRENTPTRKKLV